MNNFNHLLLLNAIIHTAINILSIIVPIILLLAIGFVLIIMVRKFKQWSEDNASPVLTVPATVIAKRTEVSSHYNGGDNYGYNAYTCYYVTFEVDNNDTIEFSVHEQQYHLLNTGEYGNLTFQGTRYHRFTVI